ncbi:hypothetical protein NLU13_1628 [Sarocladium strictum]|uniref:Pentatricopeptide repeat domain-containing protein n=1 Tax=Sarocladium strictum TaxID=5046 RepID=A0AA39GRB9_SARSR|nr:hypothetical protein NLU13_1628 [Sarocladium strictum]
MSSQSYEWDAEGLQELDYLGALLFKKSTTSASSASPLVRQRDRPSLLTEIRKRSRNLPVLQDPNALQMPPDNAPRSSNSHALPDHGEAALEAPSSSWPKHQPSEISDWENLARHLQHERGAEAAWEAMSPLAKEGCHLLAHPNAGLLRDAFLEAAVGDDVRLNEFVGVANALRDRLGYEWPDLYGNVLYRLLDAAEPGRAMLWHSRLYSLFTPSQAVFAALLSHFVVDESPEMQNTLIKLHDSSKAFGLYDTVIARLFNFGQSKTARAWRKRLLSYNDFPLTEASVPFLRFLSAYYPLLQLTAEEREILKPRTGVPTDVKTRSEAELEEIRKSIHGDHIVAKWFASTWTTVEFAIDLVHRFGVANLGPLALQALGLRDPGAKNLAEHLTQLESLGVALAPMTYCRIIAHFARQGDDDLLHGILTCDIHPDEFEDIETVRMLAVSAENQRDAAQHRLMRAIETAMQTISAPDDYDKPSFSEDLGSFQSALTPAQGDSAENLDLTFDRLGYHPRRWLRRRAAETSRLDQAVVALRQAFADDVPIPLDYWKRLLYNYGRLGRLKSLEQLGLELVQMYGPANARRIPIYHNDFPASASSHDPNCGPDPSKSLDSESKTDGLELWQQALDGRATGVQEILYFPSDLPFSHRQHPIQKIFHQRLQRNVIRWGFDLALRATHAFNGPSWRRGGISNSAWRATQLPVRGVAQGLRVLARLRDVGVLIDPQIVQSEIVRRVVAADFPGRGQAPWVDHHELDLAYIVRFVNKVWGPGVFESPEDLKYLIRARENKIREHYWKNRSSKGDLLVQQMKEDGAVADV